MAQQQLPSPAGLHIAGLLPALLCIWAGYSVLSVAGGRARLGTAGLCGCPPALGNTTITRSRSSFCARHSFAAPAPPPTDAAHLHACTRAHDAAASLHISPLVIAKRSRAGAGYIVAFLLWGISSALPQFAFAPTLPAAAGHSGSSGGGAAPAAGSLGAGVRGGAWTPPPATRSSSNLQQEHTPPPAPRHHHHHHHHSRSVSHPQLHASPQQQQHQQPAPQAAPRRWRLHR